MTFTVSLCKDCVSHDWDAAPFGPHGGPWGTFDCPDARAVLDARTPDQIARDRAILNGWAM